MFLHHFNKWTVPYGYHSGWDYIEALFHLLGHIFPEKVVAHELLDRR